MLKIIAKIWIKRAFIHKGNSRTITLIHVLNLCFCLRALGTSENIVKMNAIGLIEGKSFLIIDDIADTCGTLLQASKTLKRRDLSRLLLE